MLTPFGNVVQRSLLELAHFVAGILAVAEFDDHQPIDLVEVVQNVDKCPDGKLVPWQGVSIRRRGHPEAVVAYVGVYEDFADSTIVKFTLDARIDLLEAEKKLKEQAAEKAKQE